MPVLDGLYKKHHGDDPLPAWAWWTCLGISGGLVLLAGLMSGLTLALMSMDEVDMEMLKRSGTEHEKRCAHRIERVIKNQHLLLVTLLLCNAAATEALPLFLDRLADPITAVLMSVSVVLVFGEVLPQAVCTRYGLQVGASSAWLVRALMVLMWPLAAPIAKLLDVALGGHQVALMRRAQLKALVGLHAQEEGGVLSPDEISIITGALDLTSKTAWSAMTPLDKVFMVDLERLVDEGLLAELLNTGHSRVPVYRNGDRRDLVGLILVKELVLLDLQQGLVARDLQLRPLPRVSADTPMYMLLQLFEAGGSHMVALTKPRLGATTSLPRVKSGLIRTGSTTYWLESCGGQAAPDTEDGWGTGAEGDPVGIITIEDAIEELLQQEIIDETDRFMDNEQLQRVDHNQLSQSLPDNLRMVYAQHFTPRVGRLGAPLPARQRPGGGAARRNLLVSVQDVGVSAQAAATHGVHTNGDASVRQPVARVDSAGAVRALVGASKHVRFNESATSSPLTTPLLEGSGDL